MMTRQEILALWSGTKADADWTQYMPLARAILTHIPENRPPPPGTPRERLGAELESWLDVQEKRIGALAIALAAVIAESSACGACDAMHPVIADSLFTSAGELTSALYKLAMRKQPSGKPGVHSGVSAHVIRIDGAGELLDLLEALFGRRGGGGGTDAEGSPEGADSAPGTTPATPTAEASPEAPVKPDGVSACTASVSGEAPDYERPLDGWPVPPDAAPQQGYDPLDNPGQASTL